LSLVGVQGAKPPWPSFSARALAELPVRSMVRGWL